MNIVTPKQKRLIPALSVIKNSVNFFFFFFFNLFFVICFVAIQHYLKPSGILQDELFFSDVLKNASDRIDFLSFFSTFSLSFVLC